MFTGAKPVRTLLTTSLARLLVSFSRAIYDYDNRKNYVGMYGQDSWRVRPNLTLTLACGGNSSRTGMKKTMRRRTLLSWVSSPRSIQLRLWVCFCGRSQAGRRHNSSNGFEYSARQFCTQDWDRLLPFGRQWDSALAAGRSWQDKYPCGLRHVLRQQWRLSSVSHSGRASICGCMDLPGTSSFRNALYRPD